MATCPVSSARMLGSECGRERASRLTGDMRRVEVSSVNLPTSLFSRSTTVVWKAASPANQKRSATVSALRNSDEDTQVMDAAGSYSEMDSSDSNPIPGTSSLELIESQAKTSIEKLKHILYKLKSRRNVMETTFVSGDVDDLPAGSATAVLRGDERQVYVSQKIEVDMSAADFLVDDDVDEDVIVDDYSEDEEVPADAVMNAAQELDLGAIAICDDLPAESSVELDSLTCTRATVQFDEENQTAIVTVQATVRGADLTDRQFLAERTVAMAARALTRTCLVLDEKAELALMGTEPLAEILPSASELQHAAVLRHLSTGKVASFKALPEGPCGSTPFRPIFEVLLVTDGGAYVEATFKPAVPGDAFGRWKRAPADWVAYKVSTLLGLDLLPPTVIRQNVLLGGMNFALGSMAFRVRDAKPATQASPKIWSSEPSLISSVHILDALLGSAPRPRQRFMVGSHWSEKGEVRPVVLDHPMGPGFGELHAMWSQRGGRRKGVKKISATLLSKLKGLKRGLLVEVLSGAVTPSEMDTILEKRDQVVSYIEAMASRESRHAVAR